MLMELPILLLRVWLLLLLKLLLLLHLIYLRIIFAARYCVCINIWQSTIII